MSKFSTKVPSTRTLNKAGGKAFSMNPETELVHAVLTTFLEDKFYESGSDRLARIQNLVAQNKPQFVANLAIIARKEFNLRSVTTVLLGELVKFRTGDSLVKNTIVEASLRPDDLTELVAYCGTPLPKQVKRGVRNALLKFSPYQLAKYKQEGKTVSLVDVFNMVHPKAQHASPEQAMAWEALVKGELKSFDTWEVEISSSTPENKKDKWEALVNENKLGYMALLRNLRNLIQVGVSDDVISKVIAKLTDPEEVAKSKQLPFRFTTAFHEVMGNRAISDAISVAMDIAVSNAPKLPGKTLIAVDSSGSMTNGAIQKASIFAATLLKANVGADVILYDTSIKELALSGRTPVIDLAHKIEKAAMGGGTQTSLVFDYAKKKTYDRIIILSDNESWSEGWGYSVQDSYNAYKSATGSDPYIYAIDIQGYGTKDVTDTKVSHLTGWSDRLLDFIGQVEEGQSLIEYIRNYGV